MDDAILLPSSDPAATDGVTPFVHRARSDVER